ncbi:serum amyloid P-component-like [Pseudonaja textilis]|uniref:serum amyloid P-component-like n=1 Tax=Pseudonaja textilis TaxID=8673 RepID=UPI000EA9B911|nr:serum amyloid P-component-like [Pseudonaja textilis]
MLDAHNHKRSLEDERHLGNRSIQKRSVLNQPFSMESLRPFLFILSALLGALAQQDLKNHVFVFPEASNTAHVVLEANLKKPLTSFTICERVYTDLTRGYSTFSYATAASDNDIIVHRASPTEYEFYLGRSKVAFKTPASTCGWEHVCVAWESSTGIVELWLNGVLLPRKGIGKGYAVSPNASIVLGQDQDTMGGGFDSTESLVGELTDLYFFERVLTPQEVTLLRKNVFAAKAIISWRALSFQIKGYVVVKPFRGGFA